VKEISSIINEYDSLKKTSAKLALATVIDVKGSSYRRTGARMLIQDNGQYTGGISGGCIEGNALKKAQMAMFNGKATQVTYDTSKDNEAHIGVSLGCNGIITVLITPIDTVNPRNAVEQLKSCLDSRDASLIITVLAIGEGKVLETGQVIKYGAKSGLEFLTNTVFPATIQNDFDTVLNSGRSMIKEYGAHKLFLEFIPPSVQIIIMGGNYDVYPLLKIANHLGWTTVMVANPRRLSKSIHQLADKVVEDFGKVIVDKYSAAILMSHDYNTDLGNLKQALVSELLYIGLLGPASRKKEMLQELGNTNPNDETRIYGPAGLDIGASQPEEIAVSIIAEILKVFRQRPGSSLRDRQGPIYDR
jgi:xanthine dehydrogenase accessory factor